MIEPFLTQEMLLRISRMAPGKRSVAMKMVAKEEWARCAESVLYWMDPQAHLLPYCYTKDPKVVSKCLQCPENGLTYTFDKRHHHLLNTHHIEASHEAQIRQYFEELDTIRPLPMLPYFKPITEMWLREPLVALEKSRDMMATWLIVALYTWDSIFHKGKQNMFQSEDATKTRELIERAWGIYSNQPAWLKLHKATKAEGTNRAGIIRIASLQSEVIGMPQGASKIRMYHPSGVFSDEAAFNPDASETFAAIKPAISGGGRYTAISSANPSWFMRVCRDTLEAAV